MLTHKIIKTISVNLGVNYRQFEVIFCLGRKNALGALATQNKIENDRFKWLRFVYYIKVYLSIGNLLSLLLLLYSLQPQK